jgi:hypothetical protein
MGGYWPEMVAAVGAESEHRGLGLDHRSDGTLRRRTEPRRRGTERFPRQGDPAFVIRRSRETMIGTVMEIRQHSISETLKEYHG